jgi:phosphoglycerate dehydrogenase-like enzyme
MAISTTGIKHKPLSTAENLNVISKVDGTPNVSRIKTAEELGIPVTTLQHNHATHTLNS